jgi:hypothetical protein
VYNSRTTHKVLKYPFNMDIDLNEDNYSYHDLLNLFSLNTDFNISDLKKAKRKVLQLHPDKCGLDVKYFLFFSKMYKKIQHIYSYTHHETNIYELKKEIDVSDHFKVYLEQNNIDPRKNYDLFSREFNKMFDAVYIANEADHEGYEEWLKSDEGMYDKNDLEASRRKAIAQQAIVETRQDIEEVGGDTGYFTKLRGFDVKETHNNPFIALDIEKTYAEKPKFKNVQEYQQFLATEDNNNSPVGLEQSKQLLLSREKMLHNQAKHMAYEHMQKSENMQTKYNNYISNYLKLER